LKEVLHNHINAEISGGTITNKLDAVEYLTWTFFFRRLLVNPSYYGCDGSSTEDIQVTTPMIDADKTSCLPPLSISFLTSVFFFFF
jgi:hypothetical protein